MAIGCLLTLPAIQPNAVRHQVLHDAPASEPDASLFVVLADRRLLALGMALLLFHLGNAAMLPLLARLRGFGNFAEPHPLPINGLAEKVFTTAGVGERYWWRHAAVAVAATGA
jgi:hypothetical protein